jgi:hypothetical protein
MSRVSSKESIEAFEQARAVERAGTNNKEDYLIEQRFKKREEIDELQGKYDRSKTGVHRLGILRNVFAIYFGAGDILSSKEYLSVGVHGYKEEAQLVLTTVLAVGFAEVGRRDLIRRARRMATQALLCAQGTEPLVVIPNWVRNELDLDSIEDDTELPEAS